MNALAMPEDVYTRRGDSVLFKQLAVKVEMDPVSNDRYFAWLDATTASIGAIVPGARIAEKELARTQPPLNVAIYYDTADHRILPTGALLRTSCNRITHAFCAFKEPEDGRGVRDDHRHVFGGDEKRSIQEAPDSPRSVEIVRRLLARRDLEHPGTFLERRLGIRGEELWPAIRLEDYRFTFFAWIDGQDALRCSIDRFEVLDLRRAQNRRVRRALCEVEIAVYPRIDPAIARDPRVLQLIDALSGSLCREFGVRTTKDIKYQRAARALGLRAGGALR
jgi:hypothetical protein